MPIQSHAVPITRGTRAPERCDAMPEDEFNAALWRLPQARRVGLSTLQGSLQNLHWPADGGRLTQLRCSPWEGATALFFDFRLRQPLQVCLDPRDELLLTFFLAGEVTGKIGARSNGRLRALDFRPGRALLRTPNRAGGYLIHVPGACRNVFVQFRLKRAQLPAWLRALDVHLDTHHLQRLMHLDDGTVLCNAALTSRIQQCLARIRAEDVETPAFAPLFQARSVELLTYVLLDLVELLRPARSPREPGQLGDDVPARMARAWIDEDPARAWTLAALAEQAGCSAARLQRGFHADTGHSVHQYLRHARLALAARLLRDTQLPVQQIAHEVGWQCHGRFGAAFRQQHGLTPVAFRLRA